MLERFLKSRKAQEGGGGEMEAGKFAILLIMGAIGAFVVINMTGVVGGGYIFASGAGQSTDKTFEGFTAALQLVVNGSSKSEMVPFSFSDDDHLIAVFDTRHVMKSNCVWFYGEENFVKPKECGNNICAVVCNEDDFCQNPISSPKIMENSKDSNAITIVSVGVDPDFEANLGKEYAPGKEYALIYGDCDGWSGEPLMGQGIKWVLIEAKDDNTTIMITDKACPNKKTGARNANCYSGTTCQSGMAPVYDYGCDDDRICCI